MNLKIIFPKYCGKNHLKEDLDVLMNYERRCKIDFPSSGELLSYKKTITETEYETKISLFTPLDAYIRNQRKNIEKQEGNQLDQEDSKSNQEAEQYSEELKEIIEKIKKRVPDFVFGVPEKDLNNLSTVIEVKFCGKTILLPGDIQEEGWQNLINYFISTKKELKCDLLKVSHHGSSNGTPGAEGSSINKSTDLSKVIHPEFSVATCHHKITNLNGMIYADDLSKGVCYDIGYRKPYRLSCSFAFKPNAKGDNATIIPLLYLQNVPGEPPSSILSGR